MFRITHIFISFPLPVCLLPILLDYSCPDQIKLDTNVYPTYLVQLFFLQSHAGYHPPPPPYVYVTPADGTGQREEEPETGYHNWIGTPPQRSSTTPPSLAALYPAYIPSLVALPSQGESLCGYNL